MRMIDDRKRDGRRPSFAKQIERMAALINTPSIVLPAMHQVNRFVCILPVLAYPELPRLAIERQSPGIAKPKRPDLRPGAWYAHKRVVFRNGVGFAVSRMIHVDADHRAVEMADILPAQIF